MRILVADDVRMTEKILKNFFKDTADFVYADSGRTAIEAFTKAMQKSRPFDLIILDILMPNIDGISALKHIRMLEQKHEYRHTPIMMLTGVSDAQYVVEAKKLNCDAYMLKPINRVQFFTAIKKMGLNLPKKLLQD